jgi:hypothetical protein
VHDQVLGHIGRCIYCGITSKPLRREHIVPFGLDGPWVLDAASCTRCAAITSKIERYVLRKHLLSVRAGLGIRTRRPRERPDHFPIELLRQGRQEVRELKISDHPVFLLLPLYDWPECVSVDRRRPGIDGGGIRLTGGDLIQVAGKPVSKFKQWLAAEQLTTANFRDKFSPELFARLIAKIAYGFAVVKLGLDAIENAYVLPAILGHSGGIGQWVGCDLDQSPAPEDASHRVTIRVVNGEILGHVKLFAQFGTQEYLVAVGEQRKGN